jgi:ribosomal protein S27AE
MRRAGALGKRQVMGGHRTVERVCERCERSFAARISNVKVGKGRFCSKRCCPKPSPAGGRRKRAVVGALEPCVKCGRPLIVTRRMESTRRIQCGHCEYTGDQARARRQAKRAVKSGARHRRPCERCGGAPTEAHHDDYTRPLDVRWLCRRCHHDVHFEKRRAGL